MLSGSYGFDRCCRFYEGSGFEVGAADTMTDELGADEALSPGNSYVTNRPDSRQLKIRTTLMLPGAGRDDEPDR